METVGVKLHPETIKLLDQISDRTETSRSWAARRLLLLGLELYMRDRSAVFQAIDRHAPGGQLPKPEENMAERIRRDAEASQAVRSQQAAHKPSRRKRNIA